ncbi:uncharacterized protein FIBRA_05658 [Fibroporia radiculosa]|uniref:Uncharacterized protein n=1 Tax=Fibroporia radiculosa TaxID=599839 RepID=J4H3M9_9APHY|nr:uncharacterized protein FIBRA_05658 [Fibroporia radiculosa]CCM03524.1 predicted protein [Fibroporia radiculosa]
MSRPTAVWHLRPAASNFSVLRRTTARHVSSKIRQPRPWAEENVPPVDPRPSWVFPLFKIANYVVIPGTLLYAVFFADFGEKEHVFMPARRWFDRQKAAFFSLSDEERRIAEIDLASGDNKIVTREVRP